VQQRSSAAFTYLSRIRRPSVLLRLFIFLIAAGLLVYSQTMSFVWDEGFHLLAAQLIDSGKIPYLDFCFPQTPLNAYWNAAWMHIFGEGWRLTHVLAALEVSAAVYLIAEFVFASFPIPRWGLACAIVTACLTGLNTVVVQFGTVAQAYGVGLFLTVAAFRICVLAVRRHSSALALAGGLCAGAAAASTLLTAPVIPVLLLWILIYEGTGRRWVKAAAFAGGVLIAFSPVFWLLATAPRQTLFNVIEYQALYRRVKWAGATPHDIDVLSAWLESVPVFLMGSLAIVGAVYAVRKRDWPPLRRGEFYLCAWLAVALTVYIAIAHPTFQRYFIFVIPFASVLAAAGLYAAGSRLSGAERPFWPAAVMVVLALLTLGRSLFLERESVTWKQYEEIARKVEHVTPPGGSLYADEEVYFLTRRPPPPGMEFSYSHKLDLPPAQAALFHTVSESELNAQVKAGRFDTVQSCNDDRIDEMNLPSLFTHKADVGDCSIFWGKKPAKNSPAGAVK
jgi:4-amino-4-deoxy-L-arabinose transferase-like glycosyltransferase